MEMAKAELGRDRLSIEVLPTEHRQIKAFAALHGQTIRDYVLESVRDRLRREAEDRDLKDMTSHMGVTFKDLWDNAADSVYDKL